MKQKKYSLEKFMFQITWKKPFASVLFLQISFLALSNHSLSDSAHGRLQI